MQVKKRFLKSVDYRDLKRYNLVVIKSKLIF